MRKWLDESQRLPGWLKGLGVLLMIAAAGYVDYLIGYEASIYIFYLMPLAAAAWLMSTPAAVLTAFLCAGAWLLSDINSGQRYSHPLVPYWNATMRLVMFLVVGYSQVAAKKLLQKEGLAARRDYLTGIMNRRGFYEAAQRVLEHCRDLNQPFTLAIIDIDNFKQVNDSAGHDTGDNLLLEIANAIRSCIRATDLMGRLGGDEFAVLLAGADRDRSKPVLECISRRLKELANGGWNGRLTLSIGAATYKNSWDLQMALRGADRAMYAVKEKGKDGIEFKEGDG